MSSLRLQWAGLPALALTPKQYGEVRSRIQVQIFRDFLEFLCGCVTETDWEARVEALEALIVARDDVAVLSWLDTNLPACMELVPTPRRGSFLRGIYRYVIEDEESILD